MKKRKWLIISVVILMIMVSLCSFGKDLPVIEDMWSDVLGDWITPISLIVGFIFVIWLVIEKAFNLAG